LKSRRLSFQLWAKALLSRLLKHMGRRAVRLLSEQEFAMDLENAASPDKCHEIFPIELIERESTLRCNLESL